MNILKNLENFPNSVSYTYDEYYLFFYTFTDDYDIVLFEYVEVD